MSRAGLIASITDSQSNTTTYQYDTQGDRTAVIDALRNQTTFAFDAMSRLTSIDESPFLLLLRDNYQTAGPARNMQRGWRFVCPKEKYV